MDTNATGRFFARYQHWHQYGLPVLFLVVGFAAAFAWWFRPENDPTGAVIAAYAALIENSINDDPMVLYTSLDDSAVRRLRARLATSNIIVRGLADAEQRVLRGGRHVDSTTGLPAWELWAKIERIKRGEATCQAGYRTGWSCGIGTYLCKKGSESWLAEEQNFLHGD